MAGLRDRIAAKRQAIADKNAGNERSFKWPVGKTYFRLLPGVGNAEEFFEEIGIHWVKDDKGKLVAPVGDREICFGEPCPIREGIERYISYGREMGDDDIVKRGKDMLAKSRFFANGVIIKAPGEFDKDKPVLLEFSVTAWDSMLSQLEDLIEDLDPEADLTKEGPFSLAAGMVFVVERTGTGMDTRYNIYTSGKTAKAPNGALEAATDLAAYKRSQFDENGRKALAALGSWMGEDLAGPVADAIASSPATKALAAPEAEDDDVFVDEDGVIEGEVADAELDDDDILAGLDDI